MYKQYNIIKLLNNRNLSAIADIFGNILVIVTITYKTNFIP